MESSEGFEQYLKIYTQKQEQLLLEYIRKAIDLEIKFVSASSTLKVLEEEVKNLQEELINQTEINQQAVNGLEAVTVERNSLKEKMERMNNDIQATAQGHNNRVQGLENRIRELETQLASSGEEIRQARAEVENINSRSRDCFHEVDELKKELQSRSDELNTLYKENEELKAKLPTTKRVKKDTNEF